MKLYALAGRSSSNLATFRLTVQRRITRRWESTKANPPPKTTVKHSDAPLSRTIPGPGWAWVEPLKVPFYAYGKMQHRSPYLTQLSSTLVIYFLGDLSAQIVSNASSSEEDEEKKDQIAYEPARGLRALVIGGIFAIPNYKWFMFLGSHFNYTSHAASIAVKIVVQQMVFTPCFNSYFFGMQSLLSGSTLAQAKQRIVDTVPTSWKNSWKLWPAVTAVSFTFIPPQYRSVFAGVIAIGWQTYLSWLNLWAAREEKRLLAVAGK